MKINEEPKAIDFCDQKGDILIGLGKHVHHVDHTDYLPRVLLFKMVCMEFPEAVKEDPLPVNKFVLQGIDDDLARRVLKARGSYMRYNVDSGCRLTSVNPLGVPLHNGFDVLSGFPGKERKLEAPCYSFCVPGCSTFVNVQTLLDKKDFFIIHESVARSRWAMVSF